MSGFDVIVIGSGPNGLTTAALLARAGRKVTVLERRDVVGGLAASEEFHSGYRSAGLLHDTTGLRPAVVDALKLTQHGLRMRSHRPDLLALLRAGEGMTIPGDPGKAFATIGSISKHDAARFAEFHAFIDRFRPVLADFLNSPLPNIVDIESAGTWDLMRRALRVRRLGGGPMMDLLRVPPLSVRDWLDEWFTTDLLKASLALDAVGGNWLGPRSPGSAANLLLHEAVAGPGIEGGGHALVAALRAAAEALGVVIRTGARVARAIVHDGKVTGVALDGGEEIASKVVAASCDPKTAFAMLPEGAVPFPLRRHIADYRMRGSTAQVLLALNKPLRFACREDEDIARARTGRDMNELERAFDAIKYRRFSERPILDIFVPSVESPDIAPAGHAVVSMLVHYAPRDLDGGWNDEQRRQLGDAAVAALQAHAPGVKETIVSGQVLTPEDIEQRYGIAGGHIFHGECALDQILVRPTPECSGHATPVPGFYLCGGGTHPGGGLTCAPGALAAARILKDRRFP